MKTRHTDISDTEARRLATERLNVARQMRPHVERAWDAYWRHVSEEPAFSIPIEPARVSLELDHAKSEIQAHWREAVLGAIERLGAFTREQPDITISSPWAPRWAGLQPAGAGTPPDEHVFEFPDGRVTVVCSWQASDPEGSSTGNISLTWESAIPSRRHFWAVILNAEETRVLGAHPLGDRFRGECPLSEVDLGFDPGRVPWCVVLASHGVHE